MKPILTIAVIVLTLIACQKKETPSIPTPPSGPPQPKTSTAEARTLSVHTSYVDVVERVAPI
ncbi:MAG TPA: hypothetical protein VGA09_10450 [Candidatus Binatia bacterium]